MKFIVSVRFMYSSLSSLVDNLGQGLFKYESQNCKSELEYKENTPTFKCLDLNKYEKNSQRCR